MSAMLSLSGCVTKALKPLRKQIGAIVRQAVEHKPIWVFFAAAVISLPCAAEAPTVNGAKKVTPELVSGRKMPGKDLDQSAVKRVSAKPCENGRVDICAEGESSGSQTGATLSPERQAMSSDVAKQDNDGAYECGDYCGFYGWLPFILAWPILFRARKTPNVI